MSKFKLKLDTYKRNIRNPTITIRQGDSNQQIECSLTDNLSASDITNSEITFYATTSNGAKVIDSNVIKTDVTKGVFVYNLPSALGQDVGQCKNAYFEVKADKAILTTQAIDINVIAGVDLTADEAGNYVTTASKALDSAKDEIAKKFEKVATNLDGFDDHLTSATDGLADKANALAGQLDDKVKQLTSDLDGHIKSVGEAQHAVSADQANTANHADTATSADQAGHASTADKATTADTAKQAGSASNADNATNAVHADSADIANSLDKNGFYQFNKLSVSGPSWLTSAEVWSFTSHGSATFDDLIVEGSIKQKIITAKFELFGMQVDLKRIGDVVDLTIDYKQYQGPYVPTYSIIPGGVVPKGFRPVQKADGIAEWFGKTTSIDIYTDGSLGTHDSGLNALFVQAHATYLTADDMP